VVDKDDKILGLSPLCNEYEDVLDFVWHRLKSFRLQFISDFLVKSDALREIGGFFYLPDAWGSDDFTWTLIAENGGIAYTSQPLFYYRDHPLTITNTMKIKNKIVANQMLIKNIVKLLERSEYSVKIEMIRQQLMSALFKKNIGAFYGYFGKKNIGFRVFTLFYAIYFTVKYRRFLEAGI